MNDRKRMSPTLLDFSRSENDVKSGIEDEHVCDELLDLYPSEFINFVIVSNRELWYLFRETYADDQAVLGGIADKIGESIDQSGVFIIFCPFCGKNLGEKVLGKING